MKFFGKLKYAIINKNEEIQWPVEPQKKIADIQIETKIAKGWGDPRFKERNYDIRC